MGLTPPPFWTMLKKNADLAEVGTPYQGFSFRHYCKFCFVHNMTFQTTPNIFWKLRSPTKSGPLSTDPPTTHSSPFLTIRQTQLATFHLKCSLHQIHQFSFTWVTRFTRITQFARITRIDKGRRKKKLVKSGQADRLGCPPPPPKRSGKCEKFSTSCHIWGYFAIL